MSTSGSRSRFRRMAVLLVLAGLLLGTGTLLRSTRTTLPTVAESTPRSSVVARDSSTGEVVEIRLTEVTADGARSAAAPATASAELPIERPGLVSIEADGYLPRVMAIAPGQRLDVALVPRTDGVVSIRFGGDVMMGRRFYEAPEGERPLLTPQGGVDGHRAILADIAPLLADADLTVVNLETPLVRQPYFSGERPPRFHRDKDLAFATAPGAAVALVEAGVDVVDLGNNHVYDVRRKGLRSTIDALERAGIAYFGAGMTPEEAWRPAYIDTHGTTVAFVACTTVTGDRFDVTYVAGPDQGGAARCQERPLRAAIEAATRRADQVVFMLHGGIEYHRRQTAKTERFTDVAVEAGATAVVNGHPHVVGGIDIRDGVPVVESVGNLVFDQQLWATLASYLVRITLGPDGAVRTEIDPFAIEDYRPVPTVRDLAEASSRYAAGFRSDGMVLGRPGALSPPIAPNSTSQVRGAGESEPIHLGSTAWPVAFTGDVGVAEDLLWGTGTMEEFDVDQDKTGPMLWELGKFARTDSDAACSGERGLHLQRSPVSENDVIAFPVHRVPVEEGSRLSLIASVARATEGSSLEIRWYRSMAGPSVGTEQLEVTPVPLGDGCRRVRIDVTVPPGVVAAQPYVRLTPSFDANLSRQFWVDDVHLLRWGGPDASGRRFGWLAAGEGAKVEVRDDQPALATAP